MAKESGLKEAHRQKILDTLIAIGKGTAYDIAKFSGIDHVAVSRRLSEMPDVYDTGEKGLSPSNRPCILWAAHTTIKQTTLFQ